jgi:hypothetical protein
MTVNRENVLKVADAIERHSIKNLGFNMGYFMFDADPTSSWARDNSGHSCGTIACIAGWTRCVRTGRRFARTGAGPDEFPWQREADWLGLDTEAGYTLFLTDDELPLEEITSAEAVAVLRHLADTGEVDWSVADKVAPVAGLERVG